LLAADIGSGASSAYYGGNRMSEKKPMAIAAAFETSAMMND
jgi:hypothetical protein